MSEYYAFMIERLLSRPSSRQPSMRLPGSRSREKIQDMIWTMFATFQRNVWDWLPRCESERKEISWVLQGDNFEKGSQPWVMVEAWRQLQYKCILYIAWMFEAGHTQSEWESQQKDGEAGLNLSVERFSPTLEKALWVKGKAWRQKQTPGEVSDQL